MREGSVEGHRARPCVRLCGCHSPAAPHAQDVRADARSTIVIVKARPFLYMDELARELAVRCGTL
jgi:hypothetical protein